MDNIKREFKYIVEIKKKVVRSTFKYENNAKSETTKMNIQIIL